MIKAPLDEKNISPTTIIDDLTCCNNIGKGDTAVGYIGNAPVLFIYTDNVMQIIFHKGTDLLKHKCELNNYIKDMTDNTDNLYVRATYAFKSLDLRFYWKEEEDNE